MSGQSLNARNPYGNPVRINQQQTKRPLKNPFENIQVRQDDTDNDFQTLNLTNNQGRNLQTPFGGRAQEDTSQNRTYYAQTSNNNQNNRTQPFGNTVENTSGVVRRNSGNAGVDPRNNQGGAQGSNMYPGQVNQPSAIGAQEPYYNNSFISSLSGINNFFGGGQQAKPEQGAQVYDEENEPPLLEDLGIDLELIKVRTLAVLRFKELDERFAQDADMSGPLLIALAFGALLLLKRKITFGYIYGFGSVGTIAVYLIMNLLSQTNKAKLYNTYSILGYCLLPIVALSGLGVFLDLVTWYGFILCTIAIIWATAAATKFFVVLLHLHHQKFLVGYPVLLFYLVFVLITIF